MYYKVVKDGIILDVLDDVRYVKYQKKHNIFLTCDPREGQGIYSSDRSRVWHVKGLNAIPVSGYEAVELIEIDQIEYQQRKQFNKKTANELMDAFTVGLAEGRTLQLVESLVRCYKNNSLNESQIKMFVEKNLITQEDFNLVIGSKEL